MATDNSEVLDISKENIQPLRHGRKASQLKTALQAQVDPDIYHQLLKQREKYEFIIRMYEGEDPLSPYFDYILWLEQSFPCMGRDNNIFLLLEDALLKFKDCKKYQQDPRLIQMLIKYINFQSNALELYQLVYNQGLGTMCSSFYKAWAEELEKSNDFKRADQVFQLGLQCRAEPVKELQDAHIQFQLSIARKLLEGNINSLAASSTTNEQSRAVLSSLQPSKVRSSRISKNSAGIFTSSKSSESTRSVNFGIGKFQIYQEDNDDDQLQSRCKNESEGLPKGSTANCENVASASKWCGQKVKQVSSKRLSTATAPTFAIHEDPKAACENIKTVIRVCALKTRKEEFKCPVAIFGLPNPNQIPMYPKQLVYVGGRDVQLEEIRAAFYWKKIEKQNQINMTLEPNIAENKNSFIIESRCSSNIEPVQYASELNSFPENQPSREQHSEEASSNHFTREVTMPVRSDRYTKLFQSADSQLINGCDMLITPARPVANIEVHFDENVSCTQNSKSKSDICERIESTSQSTVSAKTLFSDENVSCDSKPIRKNEPFSTKTSVHSIEKDFTFLKPVIPCAKVKSYGGVDLFVDDGFDVKQTDKFDFMGTLSRSNAPYLKKSEGVINEGNTERDNVNFNHSLSASMTINTKAAMNVIQQMWESPLTQQDTFETVDTMDIQSRVKSNKCLFPMFGKDDHPPDTNSNKISFPVFCDETFSQLDDKCCEKVNDLPSMPFSKPKQEPIKLLNACKKGSETERKFGTPLPLIIPIILQDSPIQPENKENRFPAEYSLVHDCRSCDEESNDDEYLDCVRNREIDDDTCNTKVFAVTLPSSTPCSRKEPSWVAGKSVREESYVSQDNDFSICYSKSAPHSNVSQNISEYYGRSNRTTKDLSLILENSKEQGSNNSSSSSGNTGSKLSLS